MLLLMVVAAVVSVTQLAVLGSWARSLRITTLLQLIAVGFLVCGFGAATIQVAWTRIVAAVSSATVHDVQDLASWTLDPFIEEFAKIAPLLWLAWRRPRTQRQLGYTDHLLFGAALGMGFELLEAALRYGRLGLFAQHLGDRYIVDGGLFGIVTVPSIWRSLFTWQPVPAATEELFSSTGDTIQHLVWTALAAVGIAWLTRRRDRLRLLGLVPLLVCAIDHANYNMRAQAPVPLSGWWSDLIAWVGAQLSWLLVVVLVVAVLADRIIQVRGRRRSGSVLLPGEPATGLAPWPVLRSAVSGFPWGTWVSWQFVLSRRAAMTALTGGETSPHLHDGVASTAGQLARVAQLPRHEAQELWRKAVRRLWDGVDLKKLRSPRMLVWAIAGLPAFCYLVIGAFPITSGLQKAMTSQVGLWLMVAGVVVGGVLTFSQLKPLRAALRAVEEPSLHERRLRLQARLGTAVAALGGGVLVVVLALVVRDPSAPMVPTFHVLDAISDALMVLGLALVLASFFLFPPVGLVALAGGGLALVPTAVAGSFVIAASAGAILASLGYLLSEAADSGGGSSSGGGGEPPPRFTDNARQSRSYGSSVSDIIGQGRRWAARMRRQGYDVSVGRVRYGKYGHADVTVTIRRNGVIKHIRHFIYKGQ